jgi:hypothetical protein
VLLTFLADKKFLFPKLVSACAAAEQPFGHLGKSLSREWNLLTDGA